MIKLTKRVEYALIAIKYINDSSRNNSISVKDISQNNYIPYNILAKVLQKLSRIGIVRSSKGKYGGYEIAVELDKVSFADFIEKIEGPIAIADCSIDDDCRLFSDCSIKVPVNKINTNIKQMFSKISLNEITS
tara:strand:+ start:46 stop:444 length:399 start_codon:yes stop_codon:yes gene_type:complete